MSDDLVKQLECWLAESETREATLNDRITMLEEHLCLTEEKLSKCEALLAKAVVALRGWIDFANAEGMPVLLSDLEAAELTGQGDE